MSKDNNEEKQRLIRRIERDIQVLVDELKTTNSPHRARDIINSIVVYINIVRMNDLVVFCPLETEFEMRKVSEDRIKKYDLKYDKAYLDNNINLVKKFNHKMCKISDYFKKRYDLPDNIKMYQSVSQDETFRLAQNFLEQYDDDVYNHYMDIKDKDIFTCKLQDGEPGDTFRVSKNTYAYLLIDPSNSIFDAFTLVHEVMHSYVEKNTTTMNEKEENLYFSNNCLEVYSIFIELLFYDYLKMINYQNYDLENYYSYFISCLCKNLEDYKKSKYIDPNSQRYSYGYILAYHFYGQYQKDKEKAKENIYKFMIESKSHNLDYMFNNYGLNSADLLNPQRIEQHTIKRLERKFKKN